MQEQELFQSYEVKNWDFNPRIYKIAAVAAIFNIVALLIVGQTNLLTKKGCDSPLVGRVCQVIDTLYVGTTILSTDTETASVDYTKSELSPDDEITWIDQTGAEKFNYPEGYFGQSNPDLLAVNQEGVSQIENGYFPNIPGIPNSTNPTINGGGTTDLLSKPQELPKNNRNAVKGGIPDSPYSVGGGNNPTTYRPKNQKLPTWKNPTISKKSPTDLPTLKSDDPTQATNSNKNVMPSPSPTPKNEDVAEQDNNGIFKNKKPLKDFAVKAKEEAKTVKLDAPFAVTITADLDYAKDGKTVVLKNPKPVKTDSQAANDPAMAKLAQDAILAVGDSGWLGYLKILGVKKVTFILSQNDTELTAKILGEQKDENAAKTTASGLNAFIGIGQKTADGDEKVLLDKATVTPEGKTIVLNFAIPKQVAQEMITRKLKEAEEKEAKPQSTAQITESNKNTSK
jgi:hypothetical protein